MKPQVDKSAYTFGKYTKIDRWSSYYYQISEVLSCTPKNILEIGVGEGVLREYIQNHTEMKYQSMDLAEDLKPDLVGSITSIPLEDNSVDLVVAFEVLEHLPFDQFSLALTELARVTRRNVILSLPHFGPPLLIDLKIPLLPRFRFVWKVPFPKEHVFDGQHYWEIGKKGYSPATIRSEIGKVFHIEREYVPFENQYHHFFILTKK